MKCQNCSAYKNIYGDYEYPCYGCYIGIDETSMKTENGCRYGNNFINKRLKEAQEYETNAFCEEAKRFIEFIETQDKE